MSHRLFNNNHQRQYFLKFCIGLTINNMTVIEGSSAANTSRTCCETNDIMENFNVTVMYV